MQRSFRSRLEALERLEAERAAQAVWVEPELEPIEPPTYDAVLEALNWLVVQVEAEKCAPVCAVWPRARKHTAFYAKWYEPQSLADYESERADEYHAINRICGAVNACTEPLGDARPVTSAALAAWIRENRHWIAYELSGGSTDEPSNL